MSRLIQLAGGVALAVACAGAAARMHQICFEGPPQPRGEGYVSTAIFGCAIDGTGTCTIAGQKSLTAVSRPSPLPLGVQSPGTFAYFEAPGTAPMTATITFVDNGATVTRSCTVNPRGAANPAGPGHATAGAVLTGFSTDSSGLVTAGVWKLQAATNSGTHMLDLEPPDDFVAVGGGAMGTDSPIGAMLGGSHRLPFPPPDSLRWVASTAEGGGAAQPHRATVFVIGLRIEGLTPPALSQLIAPPGWSSTASESSQTHPYYALVANPAAEILAPSGSVVIGGGFLAGSASGGNGVGQYATASARLGDGYEQCNPGPNGGFECHLVVVNVTGWRSESKDHVIAAPGAITAP